MALPSVPRFLLAGLLVAFATFGGDPARAETLRFGGTGASYELLKQLGAAFAAANPNVTIEVVPSLGSSGGIRALADGAIDVAVSARPLKPDEAAKGLQEIAAARTPFLLVTSRVDPDPLRASDVAAAFGQADATWSDNMPIRPVLRPESESDSQLLVEYFPGMSEAVQKARSRPEIPVEATDQDSAEAAEGMEGSLAAVTLVQLVTEKRALHPIPIDGVEPTLENYELGRYPYGKTLRFFISPAPSAAAEAFARFLTSAPAAPLMRQAGILPVGV